MVEVKSTEKEKEMKRKNLQSDLQYLLNRATEKKEKLSPEEDEKLYAAVQYLHETYRVKEWCSFLVAWIGPRGCRQLIQEHSKR